MRLDINCWNSLLVRIHMEDSENERIILKWILRHSVVKSEELCLYFKILFPLSIFGIVDI